MADQFIYCLCEPEAEIPVYVGRSKNAKERFRWHGLSPSDFSPKGIWFKYHQKAQVKPNLIILEECSFNDKKTAEKWAKHQEQIWIKKLFEDGIFLLNHGCWWKHPDRKPIPKGVREAWALLHEIFFRLEFWLSTEDDFYNETTRFIAFRGIQSIVKQYPALELAPIEWLEPTDSQ